MKNHECWLVNTNGVRVSGRGNLRVQATVSVAHWLEGSSIALDFSQTLCGASISEVHDLDVQGFEQAFIGAQERGAFHFVLGASPLWSCTIVNPCRVAFEVSMLHLLICAMASQVLSMTPTPGE